MFANNLSLLAFVTSGRIARKAGFSARDAR